MAETTRTNFFALALAALSAVGCGPQYPSCDNDDDCRGEEYCVDGQCQQCRIDSDCGAGRSCNNGRCEPIDGYCSPTSSCPDGQECQNNRCIAQSTTDAEPRTTTNPAPSQACTLEPIYFSFDADQLDRASRDILAANVRCIQSENMGRVHVTGFTDPRGTEEYNLALGDRRARAVIQYMEGLGAERGSMSASSMGEELSHGESEASWRFDRKVTFTARP